MQKPESCVLGVTQKQREAEKAKVPHAPFVEQEYNACHNPHGSNIKDIIKERVDRVCYACHADAEGKFLKTYTHQPVLDGSCNACHQSHGSDQKKLVRLAGSKMCAQCHGDLMKAETSGTNHNPFAEGECLTCHDAHGSNIKGMTVNKE